jgi:hypothetical protein
LAKYEEILKKIEDFGPLITELSELLETIEDQPERRIFRRALGEVLGCLEDQIAYPIRLRLGIATND